MITSKIISIASEFRIEKHFITLAGIDLQIDIHPANYN